MGHVWVKIRLRNPWKNLEWEGDALIDTGATRTAIPVSAAKELGLERLRDIEAVTATGTVKAWLAYVEVELMNDKTIDRAIVLEDLEHILICTLML